MKLWAELNHPNVVPFVGFHIGEDIAWLISDWAPNGNVQDFLTESEVDSATRLRIVRRFFDREALALDLP